MCGRFTLRTEHKLLVEQFASAIAPDDQLRIRYNVAPTQGVATLRVTESDRQLSLLHWGLIPSWAKDAKIGYRMINARAETVAEKPSFRSAFKKRRCLVLSDGYYEWKKSTDCKDRKQPYYIRMEDELPFAFAGLWERWERGEQPLESCTIITTDANEITRNIHDRMPVILRPENYDTWLDPEFEDQDELQSMLVPYENDNLVTVPVSTTVNSPRNDVPECIKPVAM